MSRLVHYVSGTWARLTSDYEAPPEQLEPEISSLDLEDIIDEYDQPDQLTSETSFLSHPESTQPYFSAEDGKDEETTSFYSALQDGFSVSTCDLRSRLPHLSNYDIKQLEAGMTRVGFEVSWYNLAYVIKQKTNIWSIWEGISREISLLALTRFLSCAKSGEYSVEQDIECARNNNKSPAILQHISGSFKSGQLVAVLGPSGAGKTTLLNCLSRRIEEGYTGYLSVHKAKHKIRISSIPQDDHVVQHLTVRECLMFASKLRNPHPGYDHVTSVSKVSNVLGLDDCLSTRTEKISGGQKKRLSIAQELLFRPDIFILDEPTSGLDSSTCIKTLTVLKDLVRASTRNIIDPIAIVLTIHQPQREAFELFDKIYLMASGGVVIYDGSPKDCLQFIEKHSGLEMPDPEYNPAAFIIEVASGEYGQEPIDALERQVRKEFMDRHRDQFKLSPKSSNGLFCNSRLCGFMSQSKNNGDNPIQYADYERKIDSAFHPDPLLINGSAVNQEHFFKKTSILLERCWLTLLRDPKQMVGRIFGHLFIPFLIASIMGTNPGKANACPEFTSNYSLKELITTDKFTSANVQEELQLTYENTGTLFVQTYACFSASTAAMTLAFALDMRSSLKEFYNGWYSINSCTLARWLSNLPFDLALGCLTVSLTYILTGQTTTNGSISNEYRIFILCASVAIGSQIQASIGMIFAAIYMGQIGTALFASQAATIPLVLFSGFITRVKNMSKLVRLLSLSSLYRHCLEVSFIARYGYNVCSCDPTKITGTEPELTGVSDKLKNFLSYYQESQGEVPDANSTETKDIFRLLAKQISAYNTYGIEVRSCDEVIPFHLYDYGITEKDLPRSFISLFVLFSIMMATLLLVVNIIVRCRPSL